MRRRLRISASFLAALASFNLGGVIQSAKAGTSNLRIVTRQNP